MGEVRIGTSGWSYPTGPGTWDGIFYPAREAGRGRRFDELGYYAEHFDTVEVNSSFYRPPDPATAIKWAKRTPAGFDFSMKLYQKFTHLAMYQKATSPDLAGDGDGTAIPTATRVDVESFLRAVDPLADAGKLGTLLAQFPPSFRHASDSCEYLDWLLRSFKGLPVAIELRHRSWSDHEAQPAGLLKHSTAHKDSRLANDLEAHQLWQTPEAKMLDIDGFTLAVDGQHVAEDHAQLRLTLKKRDSF